MENTIGYISIHISVFQNLVLAFCYFRLFCCISFGSSVPLFGGEATKPSGKAPTSPWIPGLEESSQAAAQLRNFLAPFLCLSAFVGQAPQNALPDSMREGDSKVVLCNPQLRKAVLIELP